MSNYKHGMRHTKIFGVWTAMLARCSNPNCAAYKNYGARGILVSERWHEFASFYADMGLPKPGETLDRIDNNKGYSKDNCRWATRLEQGRNKRNNRILTAQGESKTMSDWAETTGLKLSTIWARINKGWSEHDAVTTPLITKRAGIKRGAKLRDYAFGAEHGVNFNEQKG